MKAADIRSKFLGFFEKNGHRVVPSSRLIPDGDPTLLFTNAGMNQFKNLFLGLEKRDYVRAASSQKCVRAGGKHNDLENVGFTARHHTFFEMLGNFSFGDYFKREAIHFAWEFITKEMSMPKDRLYVSVFENDDEAANIWIKDIGMPKERIFRFGEKDNFWRMGNSGPCGPCTEIFFDLFPDQKGDPKKSIESGEDRIIEFWNNVFMQFNESEDGKKTPLPKPSVDTGMGLERLATILQGKTTNYDNDLFQSLIGACEKFAKVEYVRDTAKIKPQSELDLRNVAMRVMADHARASAFLIADGVLPSNDGRGYVLRRIMRRAIRYGRKLTQDVGLMPFVAEAVVEEMGAAYPELRDRKSHLLTTIRDEEKRFLQTLDQGTQILQQEFEKMQNSGAKVLDGKFTFKLYDTFGFPLDLTQLMARERGFSVDDKSFEQHFAAAREVARASWKGQGLSGSEAHLIQLAQGLKTKSGATKFTGYHGVTSDNGQIVCLSNGQKEVSTLKNGETGIIICNQTPFYAESGGQVGDTGRIMAANGQAEVLDCTKTNDVHIHHVRIVDGEISSGEQVRLEVDALKRRATASNHSATHLLHAALRKVLGTHVTQAGSLVSPDRLRFDFTHNKPLTADEVTAIETMVNSEIAAANTVETREMSPDDAVKAGALALFGEKYGDKVRVLKMGEFSMELCGGTHVAQTSEIRVLKVVSEGSVSSGVRRIEAITGDLAVRYLMKNVRENQTARAAAGLQENWQAYLDSDAQVTDWIERAKNERKQIEKQVQSLKSSEVNVDSLIASGVKFSKGGLSGTLVFADVALDDRNALSETADKIRDKIQSGAVVLVGKGEADSHPIVVSISKNLVGTLHAGKILGDVAAALGGKGGGRPDFAQGAGKDLANLKLAKEKAASHVQ